MSALRSPARLAAEFSATDAHDDTVESVVIIPAPNRSTSCKVEVTLFRHWEKRRRLLRFSGCTNINLVVDTKVLSGNAPNNTACLEASAAIEEITKIMRRQKSSWNVRYQKSIDPLPPKLATADKYTVFRVRFFGGLLEVIAKSYKLTHLRRRSARKSYPTRSNSEIRVV